MKDTVNMNVKGNRWKYVDWIHMIHNIPVAGSCEHGNENSGSIKWGNYV
jgi:hypothetical protein